MNYEIPDHTCPDIDRVKYLLRGKLGDDEDEANELLEELRESNRLLRNAAEMAIEYADRVDGVNAEEKALLYSN